MRARLGPVTASARTLPALTCGWTLGMVPIVMSHWPAITSSSDAAPPLYGTCTTFTLAVFTNSAPARCGIDPMPDDA